MISNTIVKTWSYNGKTYRWRKENFKLAEKNNSVKDLLQSFKLKNFIEVQDKKFLFFNTWKKVWIKEIDSIHPEQETISFNLILAKYQFPFN